MLSDLSLLELALAIVGIGALIAWHELGHFWVALALKMRVLRYSVGMGPKLVGFTRKGIDYQLAWIPFGGFSVSRSPFKNNYGVKIIRVTCIRHDFPPCKIR